MSDSLQEELSLLASRIRKEYWNSSNLDEICQFIPKPDGKKRNFKWITNKILLPRRNLHSEEVQTNGLLQKILVDEMNYLLENIRSNFPTVDMEGDEVQSIRNQAVNYFSDNKPTTIMIPRSLWTMVPDWNREINGTLVESSNSVLFLGYPSNLRVVIPPNGVDFEDILISNRVGNRLQYIPDKNTNSRTNVGYEQNPDSISFYMHGWYLYEKPDLDCNVIIKRNNHN